MEHDIERNSEVFSIRLTQLRKALNLTRREMSAKLGVSTQQYWNWENKVHFPSIKQLININREFGISIDYLLGCERNNE